ncbi:MAG TPA: alginate lyase family protein [Vicinamibacterales bacterium]|nr:alginate lyase family protein [Vicinamibacterales bacterium]
MTNPAPARARAWNIARLQRALQRSPGYLARRTFDAIDRRTTRLWSYVAPSLLTERALLSSLHAPDIDHLWDALARQPFFISCADKRSTVACFLEEYPEARSAIVQVADAVLRHEFNLLGSCPQSLGASIPWHTDFKTGRQWPLAYGTDIEYNELDRPSDVKVPWELSRCQHFTRLGQAYWITGDQRYAAEFVAETTDWLAANPYPYGVNWACAMDVALRAVNWIWGFYFFADSDACRSAAFRSTFLRGLLLHGEFITDHLEKADLNGNHYLCNGVGLVFLGCFFTQARRAGRWRALGRAIVEQEIFNQTTADGVDFEQSTAYHRLVLEAFLTSYELLLRHGEEAPKACWDRLERMCEYVQAYTKPDGRAPLIGDADDGRIQILGDQPRNDHRYLLSTAAVRFGRSDFKASATRCWEETFWLVGSAAATRFREVSCDTTMTTMPSRSVAFPAGGVYVLRAPRTHLVVDCGEVGFGGRGGHGHNDILGFELFLNGFNLVTDCGAYLYTASREWRNRFRGTAFHNTVQVDGEELNRFLGPDMLWQLRYDAKPFGASLRCGDRVDWFCGGHRGYERLSPPISHTREFFVDREQPRVLVRDRLEGVGEHQLVWRLHLDPEVEAALDGCDARLSRGDKVVWLLPDRTVEEFSLSIEEGWVSPSYGVKAPTRVLVWSVRTVCPVEASYLFAEARLTREERAVVTEFLSQASLRAENSKLKAES